MTKFTLSTHYVVANEEHADCHEEKYVGDDGINITCFFARGKLELVMVFSRILVASKYIELSSSFTVKENEYQEHVANTLWQHCRDNCINPPDAAVTDDEGPTEDELSGESFCERCQKPCEYGTEMCLCLECRAQVTEMGPGADNVSGYVAGTKSHALNEVHCMLQELQTTNGDLHDDGDFDFDKAYTLIEGVRDLEQEGGAE